MLTEYQNIDSFYKKAKEILPQNIFTFIDSGSMDELAVKRNMQCLKDILLTPRVLQGVKDVSTAITIYDHKISLPVLIAPAAYQGLLSKQGELDMLAAVNQFNTTMILSMFSSTDHALVAQQKKSPLWLQMYLLKDRHINDNFINYAHELNFDALVVTVDAPVYAKKEREQKYPLSFSKHTSFKHLEALGIPVKECLLTKKHLSTLLDPTINWRDIERILTQTQIPIILKGIIDPRDTEIALQYPNIKGIIISNHGGRQLDSCLSPIQVIKKHQQIVGDRLNLFLDGGITRGSDIFKSIALGAKAILIGRAALWSLAIGGSKGVHKALSIFQQELIETMVLCGCSNIHEITSDFIAL